MPGEGQTMWQSVPLKGTALPGKEGFDDGDWIEAPYITDCGIRLLQTGNIGIGEFFDKTSNRKFISQRSFDELRCKWVHPGDVLICRLADPIGRACRVPDEVGPSVTAVDCTIYRTDPTVADSGFMLHKLNSRAQLAVAGDVAGGSTRQRISRGNLGALEFQLPPLPEQRRIAEILDTLDEAIRKTEQVIKKLRQMKQGLLQDLLTRGINEHGQLRDPQRHPEQFKDSPLGRIPKEWEVETIQGLLADVDPAMRSGPFGSALLKHELVFSGVPLLGIDNVHVESFVQDYKRFVTPKKAQELSRYLVRPSDLMITIMGTVGRCALVPENIGAALSSKHVWTISFDQDKYSPFLACVQFNHSPWVLGHLARDEQGGIMSAIRSETLRTAQLPVPPRGEQRRIEGVFREHYRRIQEENQSVAKLRTLKQGLMDDLLTGRVRVNVEEVTT